MDAVRSQQRDPQDVGATARAANQDDELAQRRAAVTELGTQLRALNEAAVRTEADPAVLRKVAAEVSALADTLNRDQREPHRPPSVDDFRRGLRMYNPVIGEGHPGAPPVQYELHGTRVEGRCTLGQRHEGPPTSSHGGVSALLLDQLLGHAVAAVSNTGVTTKLTMRYRKPVPLGVPLRLWAEAVHVDGRRTTVEGAIATADEPDRVLVEAEGRFLSLDRNQAERMLPDLFAHSAERGESANGHGH